MTLSIPNPTPNGSVADGQAVGQNFSTIADYVNSELIHRDGTVAMTEQLLLVGDATADGHAVRKKQLDDATETLRGTGSSPYTLASGWAAPSSGQTLQLQRVGRVVHAIGAVRRSGGDIASATLNTILTLNTGWQPVSLIRDTVGRAVGSGGPPTGTRACQVNSTARTIVKMADGGSISTDDVLWFNMHWISASA